LTIEADMTCSKNPADLSVQKARFSSPSRVRNFVFKNHPFSESD